ncbi:hypothetical protein CPT_Scapp_002 [Serratia phage Scapp]|uniref:Uncharacterized protein n=1 Tax=Serratia phage Scapp TaxID=2282409 RepID=A0A345L6M9_9CAUD|nr:hypothetical protein PP898_gp02 [Serratia phage Scapp]AXH50931.1 hypothetical protein CPT_Scapp_002 [Serratia phage Scapp]
MSNLELAKQLEKMVKQRVAELERTLGMARLAGVKVERKVVTDRFDDRTRERVHVNLFVRPDDVATDSIMWPDDYKMQLAWREEAGRGRLFFTRNIFGIDSDNAHVLRGKQKPMLIGVRGAEPFEVDTE